jgi:formate dehydrogenase major subunit
VTEIMDAVHAGEIGAMYVLGENPAMSDPDRTHARAALAAMDHLVVQDVFLTETAMYADVVLPADVFAEMARAMPSLADITWDRLAAEGAVAYPSLSPDDPGRPFVFGDGLPRKVGRARFTPAEGVPPDEAPDAEFPMILATGRQLEHWHTGSMTRRSRALGAIESEANASLHPGTLRETGVAPGGMLRLTTRRGSIEIRARADRAVAPDMVFLPFAYVEAAANILTNPALDPFGKIPEFKFSAVRVEPARRSAVAAE